jgi:hypothetical protein
VITRTICSLKLSYEFFVLNLHSVQVVAGVLATSLNASAVGGINTAQKTFCSTNLQGPSLI